MSSHFGLKVTNIHNFFNVSSWATSRKIALVVTGCSLLTFPFAMNTHFGNFLLYLASYYQATKNQVHWYVDPLWVISIFNIISPLSMVASSWMEKWLGLPETIGLGGVLAAVSILVSYVSIREPAALVFTYGFINAIGTGLLFSLCNKIVLQVATTRRGLAYGVMTAFQSVGSLINIGLAFAVINPQNIKPDLFIENTLYFSDPELIERVPYYFIAIGVMTVASSSLGFLMVHIVAKDLNIWNKKTSEGFINEDTERAIHNAVDTLGTSNEMISLKASTKVSVHDGSPIKKGYPVYASTTSDTMNENSSSNTSTYINFVRMNDNGSNDTSTNVDQVPTKEQSASMENSNLYKVNRDTDHGVDMTPGEALKSSRFWLIWLASLSLSHTFYITTNLYKQYGLLRITDDQMLVITGVLSTVTLIATRPLVGVFSDQFGVKMLLVQTCAVSSVFMAMMVVSLHLIPPLYIVMTIVEFTCAATYLMVTSLVVNELIGSTYYPSVIGLVYTARVVSSLVDPLIVRAMVTAVGWDWVFVSGIVSGILSMLSSLVLPEPKIK